MISFIVYGDHHIHAPILSRPDPSPRTLDSPALVYGPRSVIMVIRASGAGDSVIGEPGDSLALTVSPLAESANIALLGHHIGADTYTAGALYRAACALPVSSQT